MELQIRIYLVGKVCFLRAGPPPDPNRDQPPHPTPPQNHTYGQYFQKKLSTWIDINV